MRSGYVYKSKLKGPLSLCVAALFPQNDAFTKVNLRGLWDWLMKLISIKRIHIEEKIREHFLSICLWNQWFITPSCFDHIWNDICPNDSRRNIPFVAFVPFWFLAGKYALENPSIKFVVCCYRYFLEDILYLWKLGHVIIDFLWVVASWFRQIWSDQKYFILVLIIISLSTCSFQGFNFHSFL